MTPALRRGIPALAVLAILSAACESKSPERIPTAPQAPTAAGDAEGVRAMAVAPPLGSASSFAVLGDQAVTNTGSTVVNGDLGVSPLCAITGFPPGIVNGTVHACNAASLAAQNAVDVADTALTVQPCDVDLTGIDLGGLTLTPGVYCFSTSAQLTGTLTLNALGNAGAVWVFKIGTTLTTATGSRVSFINGGQACGTFWRLGSSGTFGTNTSFAGNVFAGVSITMNTGSTSDGALFARTGAVTLDTNVVNRVGSCGSGPQPTPTPLPSATPSAPPSPGPPHPPVPTLPEVAMWGLLAVLLTTGVIVLGRR